MDNRHRLIDTIYANAYNEYAYVYAYDPNTKSKPYRVQHKIYRVQHVLSINAYTNSGNVSVPPFKREAVSRDHPNRPKKCKNSVFLITAIWTAKVSLWNGNVLKSYTSECPIVSNRTWHKETLKHEALRCFIILFCVFKILFVFQIRYALNCDSSRACACNSALSGALHNGHSLRLWFTAFVSTQSRQVPCWHVNSRYSDPNENHSWQNSSACWFYRIHTGQSMTVIW